MDLVRALITISVLPMCTLAHMQMSNPYPINSALDPATPEYLKDYSYTSPLLANGSNFPCKGYQTQSTSYNTTATYTAGGTYNMSVTGTAKHGGGSCQLSLSYDNGQTFKVIQSMIGGCPITTTYNFTLPSFAPSSQSALFAWTWFNEIGNREMYMDCARVQIQAVAPGRHRRAQYKRQESMSSLPDLFVCNVNNGCTTIEQQDVQFPDPGMNVVYGSDDGTYPPFNGSGYVLNSTALDTTLPSPMPTSGPYSNTTTITSSVLLPTTTFNTTEESTSTLVLTEVVSIATTILVNRTPSSPPVVITSVFASAVMAVVTAPTTIFSLATASSLTGTFPNTTFLLNSSSTSQQLPFFQNTSSLLSSSSTTLSTSITASPVSSTTNTTVTSTGTASTSATLLTGPCAPGTFACNSASTFSQCVAGVGGTSSYTYIGSVATGMECSNGQIIQQNDGPCTPNGQLFCNGEYAFYLCDEGGLVNMGPVAPGTACVDGVIGYPPSRL